MVVPIFVYGGVVGAEEQPVYRGGRYLMNIYFLKYRCLVKKGCCIVKKS